MKQREQLNNDKPNRSGFTNRNRLFLDADGRSKEGRRWSDIHAMMVEDMDGADLSASQRLLLRNAATLQLSIEIQENFLIDGKDDFDAIAFARLCNCLNRCLDRLGLENVRTDGKGKREPRTLEEHIKMRIEEKENANRSTR